MPEWIRIDTEMIAESTLQKSEISFQLLHTSLQDLCNLFLYHTGFEMSKLFCIKLHLFHKCEDPS